MESPVILAMSPRVGRWNHRYFTPRRSHLTEKDAATLAAEVLESSKPDASIVYAPTLVQQPSSGRMTPEFLLVKDARLSGCSPEERSQTEMILREFLPTLEAMVKGLTESEAASKLLIHHPQLDDLAERLQRHLDGIRPRVTGLPATKLTTSEKPVRHESLWSRVVFGLILLAIPASWWLFSEPPATGDSPPAASAARPRIDTRNLKRLHEAVLGDSGAQTGTALRFGSNEEQRERIREILDRLETGLDAEPVAPSQTSEESRFASILPDYYRAILGPSEAPSLNDILANETFLSRIDRMFTPEFHPEGCIENQANAEYLKQFDCDGPRRFREVYHAFVDFQEAAGSDEKGVTDKQKKEWEGRFIADFPNSRPLPPIRDAPIPRVKCYQEEDADKAAEVARLLEAHQGEDVPKSIDALRTRTRNSSGRWQEETLKNALLDSTANGHTARAFRALQELGRVWSTAPTAPTPIEGPPRPKP